MSIQILLKSTCKKLSKQSKHPLTYNIAVDSGHYHFRISHNDGGHFSTQWIKLDDALAAMPEDEVFPASVLAPLYESSNSNNPGFLAAAMLDQGLIESVKDSPRMHRLADLAQFDKRMSALVKKKVSLDDEVAMLQAEKEKRRKALEAKLKKQRNANSKKPTSAKLKTTKAKS